MYIKIQIQIQIQIHIYIYNYIYIYIYICTDSLPLQGRSVNAIRHYEYSDRPRFYAPPIASLIVQFRI